MGLGCYPIYSSLLLFGPVNRSCAGGRKPNPLMCLSHPPLGVLCDNQSYTCEFGSYERTAWCAPMSPCMNTARIMWAWQLKYTFGRIFNTFRILFSYLFEISIIILSLGPICHLKSHTFFQAKCKLRKTVFLIPLTNLKNHYSSKITINFY